jgi:hypothetical protein
MTARQTNASVVLPWKARANTVPSAVTGNHPFGSWFAARYGISLTAVNYLETRAVVPGPRVVVDGTDATTGAAVRTTVYSGHVSLARNSGFRGAVSGNTLQHVSFYLPDGALTQAPTVMGVEMSLRRFTSLGSVSRLDLGVADEQVAVAPDPRGGGQWLYVTFRTPIQSHETLELNYRVTVQTARG